MSVDNAFREINLYERSFNLEKYENCKFTLSKCSTERYSDAVCYVLTFAIQILFAIVLLHVIVRFFFTFSYYILLYLDAHFVVCCMVKSTHRVEVIKDV